MAIGLRVPFFGLVLGFLAAGTTPTLANTPPEPTRAEIVELQIVNTTPYPINEPALAELARRAVGARYGDPRRATIWPDGLNDCLAMNDGLGAGCGHFHFDIRVTAQGGPLVEAITVVWTRDKGQPYTTRDLRMLDGPYVYFSHEGESPAVFFERALRSAIQREDEDLPGQWPWDNCLNGDDNPGRARVRSQPGGNCQ